MSAPPADARDVKADALIHREILRLSLVILLAVGAFFVTRAIAASNRAMRLRDAAEAFQRGEAALAAGRLDAATDFYRRAAARDRGNGQYVLALARALGRDGRPDEAASALLALRESVPDDPQVNLELAHLAVVHGNVAEATRFYRSALYAPWPADQAEARRRVRVEFVRMLLARDARGTALAELMALSANLPDNAADHIEAAALFVQAGDQAQALAEYQHALRLDPADPDALSGAGRAAFALGNYALADRYLRQAPANRADIAGMQAITALVLAADPLAARLGAVERGRRMAADVRHVQQRLAACLVGDGRPAGGAGQGLATALRAFAPRVARPTRLSQDEIELGVDLVARAAQFVVAQCGAPTPLDEALVRIGRQHGAGAP